MATKALVKHFSASMPTIGQILIMHPGLQECSRRWVPPELTDGQKQLRCEISDEHLNILRNDESERFSHATTGDES
jgi:hypothetical protein